MSQATSTPASDQMSQNGYITLTPGFYTCPVDGFLLGLANGTSSTCIAYAWAMCGAAGVWATGGSVNIGNDSNGNAIVVSNGNTLFLPIPAGNEFAFGDGITSYGSQPSTVVFYYLPNGDGVPTPVQNPTLQKPALPRTPPALIAR